MVKRAPGANAVCRVCCGNASSTATVGAANCVTRLHRCRYRGRPHRQRGAPRRQPRPRHRRDQPAKRVQCMPSPQDRTRGAPPLSLLPTGGAQRPDEHDCVCRSSRTQATSMAPNRVTVQSTTRRQRTRGSVDLSASRGCLPVQRRRPIRSSRLGPTTGYRCGSVGRRCLGRPAYPGFRRAYVLCIISRSGRAATGTGRRQPAGHRCGSRHRTHPAGR